MTESARGTGWQPLGGPWARVTVLFQLAIFALPVQRALSGGLDSTFWLPVAALVTTAAAGLLVLVSPPWRRVGLRVTGATVVAALLEALLVVGLVLVHAQRTGWRLH
ncbi:hypothetical protein [Nocardioides sp. SYSU D00038]|uniref:hypothetical protein n=1 Tax=Nocardioides sp. SYSU D00038 TaxID=2812554 RepID=UPI001967E8F2|nr:hypothetical protein [Nocardioides sp. SYSU D00038]